MTFPLRVPPLTRPLVAHRIPNPDTPEDSPEDCSALMIN